MKEIETVKLKPCPFCGGRAALVSIKVRFGIGCRGHCVKCVTCNAASDLHLGPHAAVAAWQLRSSDITTEPDNFYASFWEAPVDIVDRQADV